jgi:predicted ester cyclase
VPETPDSVVRRWFKEVWDEGREDTIDVLMAPYGVAYGLPGGPIQGPTAFKPVFRTFREAFGDLSIQVVRTVSAGDLVAAHCHVTGRHSGDALGGGATQQPVDFWGISMVRVEDGKIVEGWNCFDLLCMYQQIGWVANPPLPIQVTPGSAMPSSL